MFSTWKEAESNTLSALRQGRRRSGRIRVNVSYDSSVRTCRPQTFRFRADITEGQRRVETIDTKTLSNGDRTSSPQRNQKIQRGRSRNARGFVHLRWGLIFLYTLLLHLKRYASISTISPFFSRKLSILSIRKFI